MKWLRGWGIEGWEDIRGGVGVVVGGGNMRGRKVGGRGGGWGRGWGVMEM